MKDNPNELFVLDIEKLNSAVEEEVKKMKNLLEEAGVKPEKIAVLEPIIENTVWMRFKLDDAREKIKTASVAIPYNNGGGQKGIRENPLFKGVEGREGWFESLPFLSHIPHITFSCESSHFVKEPNEHRRI